MKEINGYKYSTVSFDNYEHRLILRYKFRGQEISITVYTTNKNIVKAIIDINSMVHKDSKYLKLEHRATKRQDDNAFEMIKGWEVTK